MATPCSPGSREISAAVHELRSICEGRQCHFEDDKLEAHYSIHSDKMFLCDLHKDFIYCPKNANNIHDHLHPASTFGLHCFPERFRDTDIVECGKHLIALSVIVRVNHTSKNRPYSCVVSPETGTPNLDRWGSGSVFIPRKRRRGKKCPCNLCKKSPTPSLNWYYVWVSTARHVVFDDLEAVHSNVGMFFDDSSKATGVWLQGIRLVNFDQTNDRSILECVTHDVNICKTITNARALLREKEIKLKEKYAKKIAKEGKPLLAIIVSHPHACYKQVSVGTHIDKIHVGVNCQGEEWTEYYYNAPTCSGSSGALVWLLGQERVGYRDRRITTHTHTGVHDNQLNRSGGGLDKICEGSPCYQYCCG